VANSADQTRLPMTRSDPRQTSPRLRAGAPWRAAHARRTARNALFGAIAATAAPTAASAADGTGFLSRAWTEGSREMRAVWNEGTPGLYLPFHTRHGRSSYSPEKLETLNETTWGLGYHRTLRSDRGNYRSVFGMALSDSHRDLQLQVGYAYEWGWRTIGPLEVRIGWTAMLIRRVDMYGGWPFPGVLPLFGVGTRNLDLKMTYIPRISDNMGNGDVLFMMMSYTF
jgi:hypothetical protein